jgi:hypothetical protein
MFPTMHINQTNHIEAKIDMELMFLSEATQNACLELIMSLDAEQRITYLNQFMRQVAALTTEEVATAPYEMEWLLAA